MATATTHLPLVDRRQRRLADLRVSVTDRCNFRCRYCMPREVFGERFRYLPRSDILTFEEIVRIASVLAERGLRKVRLTGGEPLLRADLPELVGQLARLDRFDLSLTTNGSLLEDHAQRLADAGLGRVTVSLDSTDPEVFARMADTPVPIERVLRGIEAAARSGLSPVKINAVVRRGLNDASVLDLARYFHGSGHIVRFIEYMDVGTMNGWRLDEVVPAREILERIDRELPLEPLEPAYGGEVARRYRYRDGGGEIGVIASVTQPFCGTCTRARLSAEGRLYTCLFASEGTDLRAVLRDGSSNEALDRLVARIWGDRDDRYSEMRTEATAPASRIEMSYIGG